MANDTNSVRSVRTDNSIRNESNIRLDNVPSVRKIRICPDTPFWDILHQRNKMEKKGWKWIKTERDTAKGYNRFFEVYRLTPPP